MDHVTAWPAILHFPLEGTPYQNYPVSRETVLAESQGFTLASATAGYTSAGAAIRYTEPYFVVYSFIDGARNGRQFTTEQEARETFTQWVARAQERKALQIAQRPSDLRYYIESKQESLASLRKYGRYGKRGALVGSDAKKEAEYLRAIAAFEAELATFKA